MKIEVELSDEENKDLEEFCKHHPEVAKNPGEALKKMAGLKLYRTMKEKADKNRRKPSIIVQDIGIPHWIPCALDEQLSAFGMSYNDYINSALKIGLAAFKKALDGDEQAQKELAEYLKQ